MLRLGTRVRHRGREGMVIARTVCGTPSYDLRLADGSVVKYAAATDCEVVAGDQPAAQPGAAGVTAGGLPLPG